jgi:hypothetical protein
MRKNDKVEGRRLKAEEKPILTPSAFSRRPNQPNLILTRHFSQRWQERVGNYPTAEAIADYIRHSVRVQGCEDLTRKNGTPFRMLAIYWHPALDLVIKVDGIRNAAVTVLSMENWRYGHPDMSGVGIAGPGPENPSEDGPAVTAETGPVRTAMADRIKGIKAMFGAKRMMKVEG